MLKQAFLCGIAEGIETPQQLERVRAGSGTSVQGYLFSRPVPQSAVPGVLESLASKEL